MTQQEVIKELQSAVSPLFWEKAIYKNGFFAMVLVGFSSNPNQYIFVINSDGVIGMQLSNHRITLESAKAHLRLHEQDWQRANPEMVRHAEWWGFDDGEESGFYTEWASHEVHYFQNFDDEINGWYIDVLEVDYFEADRREILSGESDSFESAKEDAINALINHLKSELK